MPARLSARFEPIDRPPALERILRRSLRALCRPGAAVQDQIDCAELLDAAGYPEGAALLRDVVAIRMGVAAPADMPAEGAPGGPGAAIDVAVADLAGLMRCAPADDAAVDAAALILPPRVPESAIADPAAATLGAALLDALSRPWDAGTTQALSGVLDRIDTDIVARPRPDPDGGGAPIADLAARAAIAGLHDWVVTHGDLIVAPAGSPALLHAAARARPGGLGAYCDGLSLLLRTSRDVFGLARLALERADGAGPSREAIERWSARLALRLDPSLQLDIIDDFGDFGMGDALRRMLADIVRRPHRPLEREMLWRIRDAGIDNDDFVLATAAQTVLARRDAGNRVEWMVLGEVQASGGDYDAAERSLRTALDLAPDDGSSRERLEAVVARRFDGFLLKSGFGSSRDRALHRLARRTAAARSAPDPAP